MPGRLQRLARLRLLAGDEHGVRRDDVFERFNTRPSCGIEFPVSGWHLRIDGGHGVPDEEEHRRTLAEEPVPVRVSAR
ncbi:hypothetical protein GCM10009558_001530 [Virgisporangium aurantiacum]